MSHIRFWRGRDGRLYFAGVADDLDQTHNIVLDEIQTSNAAVKAAGRLYSLFADLFPSHATKPKEKESVRAVPYADDRR